MVWLEEPRLEVPVVAREVEDLDVVLQKVQALAPSERRDLQGHGTGQGTMRGDWAGCEILVP